MKPIIEVNNLSKKYQYGERQPYYAFRDLLANIISSPLRLIRDQKKPNLEKDEFWALKDVSFTVNNGEVLGIIGPNGAGKSTLLKILSQITPPTVGEAILRGRVGSLLEVGTGFHPELTGKENIYLNGAILGMSRREINRKFEEIVEFSGVRKFLDTPVKHYSSGMYMRLAFSVAATLESEILVVDEVLAVGDSDFQKRCLRKMGDVANSGRTILLVSHNMTSIRQLCSRSLLLDQGKVVMIDQADKVIDYYLESNQKIRSSYSFKNDYQKDVQIHKISILDEKLKNTAEIPINEEFYIDIEYAVNRSVERALLCLLFYSQGELLLLSSESDKKKHVKEFLVDYSKGKYHTRVKVPAFTFNVGTYYVDISVQHPFIDYLDHKQNIYFEILNINNPKSHVFDGKILGRFSTVLDYKTTKI